MDHKYEPEKGELVARMGNICRTKRSDLLFPGSAGDQNDFAYRLLTYVVTAIKSKINECFFNFLSFYYFFFL